MIVVAGHALTWTELGKQVASLHVGRSFNSDRSQHGRHQIDERYRLGEDVRCCVLRQSDDEWHVHGGVIYKKSVRLFTVLAKAFAMVTAQYDYGILVNSFL